MDVRDVTAGVAGDYRWVQRTASGRMVNQELPMSCGAACVRQMGLDIGKDVFESVVREAARFDPEMGISDGDLGEAATRVLSIPYQGGGIVTNLPLVSAVRAACERGPWIARLKPGPHYVLVDSVLDECVQVRDPWGFSGPGSGVGTEGRIRLEDFLEYWRRGLYRAIIKGA